MISVLILIVAAIGLLYVFEVLIPSGARLDSREFLGGPAALLLAGAGFPLLFGSLLSGLFLLVCAGGLFSWARWIGQGHKLSQETLGLNHI